MLGRISRTTLAAAILWCAPGFAVDAPKSADELIAKYIEAIGGRKAIDSINSLRLVGKTLMMGGIEAPLTLELARPDKIRTEIEFQGMKLVTGFDGTTGWFISPFGGKTDPEKMSEGQLKLIRDQADFDGPLIDYKKKGHKVEFLGEDEIEGTPTYKLKLTKKSSSVEYYHFDKEYFIIVARMEKFEFQGSEMETSQFYSDYKAVGGQLFPHAVETKRGSVGGGTVTFERIEVNPTLGDERFTMPQVKQEVKQEVKKEEPTEPKGKTEDKN